VTTEGVPLQEWDFFGAGSLFVQATENAELESASEADLNEIISKGLFKASTDDVKSLLLGDRKFFSNGFDQLLKSLTLVPAGSIKTLNIIAHSTSQQQLDFIVDFVFKKDLGIMDFEATDNTQKPLQNVDLNELVTMPPEINVDGIPVKLSEVRKAFPVDGEVHVFNMSNPLREEFLQALANLFQVRTTGFTRKPVRVNATVIAQTEEEEFVLSKKIDIGFTSDPVTFQVDFFSQLLQEDRARTGLFTAFPRRV